MQDSSFFLPFVVVGSLLASGLVMSGKDSLPAVADLPLSAAPPDPLVGFGGERIADKETWFDRRRPELKELFQHYMYGYFPAPIKIVPTVNHVDKMFFGGKATLKLVTIAFEQPGLPHIDLMLVTPNQARPAPVFVGLDFNGNHSLVTDTNVPLPSTWMDGEPPRVVNHHATEAGRGQSVNTWSVEESINRGYAVATFYYGDVEPDMAGATNGIRSLLKSPGHGDPSDWGAVAAWAWGVSRVIDYLETDKNIDSKRIAAVGHSRLGKAVLLAGAFDERIAIVFAHQAGCGGTAPSRGTVGESVRIINERFPYWFCTEFKKFNDQPARLPFDQNCLIALCAPRAVLISCATGDTWSNPAGQFEMEKAADKVYRLVGNDGLSASAMPAEGKLIDSRLGYFIRPGEHSMTKVDWRAFWDFADKQFKSQAGGSQKAASIPVGSE